MRTLLVITRQPSLSTAIQTVLDPVKFQFITKEAVGEAEFLLSRGAIDATILDVGTHRCAGHSRHRGTAKLCARLPDPRLCRGESNGNGRKTPICSASSTSSPSQSAGSCSTRCSIAFSRSSRRTRRWSLAAPLEIETSPQRPYVDQVRALEALAALFRGAHPQPRRRGASQAIPPSPARDHRRESRDHLPAKAGRCLERQPTCPG